jgi:ribonuclease P protein component
MTTATPSLSLPRSRRIRHRRDFAAARVEGQRFVSGCLIANLKPLAAGHSSRVGTVASRQVGPATVRNRARRLLRESFRLHQHELRQPALVVLVARRSIAGKALAQVERDYLTVLRRAGLWRSR